MSIEEQLKRRILILDGAMGTKIQSMGLTGNNDELCLTAPDVVAGIHRQYIDAGADIITTNTFSANRISQQEYGCSDKARLMALEGARIARRVADEQAPTRGEQGGPWVAGSMGPTSKSLTLASDMNDPALRTVSFDDMAAAYLEQAEALMEGGADVLLLETCFDALNTKAALYAIQQLNDRLHTLIPVMVSATINDRSGRTLTGQTLDAFYISISHYPRLLSFGLNCSFGVSELRPFVEHLSHRVPVFLSLHPNAGLPNEMGEYDELPEFTAAHLRQMAEAGLLNIAGGCCGTDERHISAISQALRGIAPRSVECRVDSVEFATAVPLGEGMAVANSTLYTLNSTLSLSGLEPLTLPQPMLVNIGERTNVAGSRKFARLIAERKYDEAMSVARHQIEGGASIIDINMDDAMLDSREAMQTFCRHIACDPAVGRAVLMIDSSDWPTIVAGLKNAQGKCIVNSISLKNGEQDFLDKARELRRLGAAVVVMAFDEAGQATTFERKTAIAQRAYQLLTAIGFPPQDIIFDVNILSVGTGLKEHQAYAVDFIRAVAWIKEHLPLAKTSGGVSNLSFAFRGNNKVREAMHSAFLYHAVRAGLDMAIVNPSMLQVYDNIDAPLLKAVEDVILNSDDGATERLIALAERWRVEGGGLKVEGGGLKVEGGGWRVEGGGLKENSSGSDHSPSTLNPTPSTLNPTPSTIEDRLSYALTRGDSSHLKDDVPEALKKYGSAIGVIEKPLMQAMEHIGQLFGEGKMFLPQVVKSAQVMKDAVALLTTTVPQAPPSAPEGATIDPTPNSKTIEAPSGAVGGALGALPVVVLATANGDVHDIGKNIVSIVLGCNGFHIIDLGVMVPCETILEATLRHNPCFVGISGLITPSLKEMEKLCQLFQRQGLLTPIVVGGATTSPLHTAVRLAPLYDGCVIHGGDASQTSLIAKHLLMDAPATIARIKGEQQELLAAYHEHHTPLTPYAQANAQAPHIPHPAGLPTAAMLNVQFANQPLTSHLSSLISHLSSLIDWRMFLLFWGFKGETLPQLLVNPEAERTLAEGKQYLEDALAKDSIQLQVLLHHYDATRHGNDIVLDDGTVLPMLRSQSAASQHRCLSDYFDEQQSSPIGLFTVVARPKVEPANEADRLMCHALCARLAEAAAEHLSSRISDLSNLKSQTSNLNSHLSPLRVAFGYATSPDHSLKRIVFDLLDAERRLDISLTDHYSIQPSTSICGLLIYHPEARYFPVGRIDRDQLADYCRRRAITVAEGEQLLSKHITQKDHT